MHLLLFLFVKCHFHQSRMLLQISSQNSTCSRLPDSVSPCNEYKTEWVPFFTQCSQYGKSSLYLSHSIVNLNKYLWQLPVARTHSLSNIPSGFYHDLQWEPRRTSQFESLPLRYATGAGATWEEALRGGGGINGGNTAVGRRRNHPRLVKTSVERDRGGVG